MTARTRTSNKDANFKVYYSKKVPKQKCFPHRKKTVREKPGARQDVPEPRQMTFIPERMRSGNIVRDSESEDEEEDEEIKEESVTPQSQPPTKMKRGQKRSSDTMQQESGDEGPVRPPPKRRMHAPVRNRTRSPVINIKSDSSDEAARMPSSAPPSESEQDKDNKHRERRRQSTMTQLVDGRKPKRGDREPEFKPVKRSSKTSWGKGKGHRTDRQQRTLTQMVPGLIPLGIVSDGDTEEELGDNEEDQAEDSQAYNDTIAKHFAQRGILQPVESHVGEEEEVRKLSFQHRISPPEGEDVGKENEHAIARHVACPVEEDADDDEESDEYQPTQDVRAPNLRRRRTSRRVSSKENVEPTTNISAKPTARKSTHSRFSLLSTPERRRIREIPSSQSPPESPLSTQFTPNKISRAALKDRSENSNTLLDTPSRLKKVTFQEPAKELNPPRPLKRKIGNIILDSEEEEDGWSEDDVEPVEGQEIGTQTQTLIRGIDHPCLGSNVGLETQAMLQQIDQACANAEEDAAWNSRDPSEELGTPTHGGGYHEVSQEPREECRGNTRTDQTDVPTSQALTNLPASTNIKQEPSHDEEVSDVPHQPGSASQRLPLVALHLLEGASAPTKEKAELSPHAEHVNSTPPRDWGEINEDLPSTPIVIKNESSGEDEATPTRPHQRSRVSVPMTLSAHQGPTDLDGEPIQVPRSPSPINPETQNTTLSHSSKAEQQIQTEWLDYSQYHRPPPSSSMNVTHDVFSYQATPFANLAPLEMAPPQSMTLSSQATTIDCTQPSPKATPRKAIARSQPIVSTNTTPRKIPDSLPFVSPQKPPPLVIPSSFPSPGRTRVDDWSSPVLGRSGGGIFSQVEGSASVDDFSIPPLPPVYDEDDE